MWNSLDHDIQYLSLESCQTCDNGKYIFTHQHVLGVYLKSSFCLADKAEQPFTSHWKYSALDTTKITAGVPRNSCWWSSTIIVSKCSLTSRKGFWTFSAVFCNGKSLVIVFSLNIVCLLLLLLKVLFQFAELYWWLAILWKKPQITVHRTAFHGSNLTKNVLSK